jgi:hypothetical protein
MFQMRKLDMLHFFQHQYNRPLAGNHYPKRKSSPLFECSTFSQNDAYSGAFVLNIQ